MNALGLRDTIVAIGLPYFASAFGIFLLRQTFKTVPTELDDAARVEGASALQVLLKVYVPLARPVYLAYALVSVSYHWNNFLWPLIVTNSVETAAAHGRPAGVLVDRPGRRLVDHHRGHADDLGAAAGRLPAVPAPVRPVVHARRHPLSGPGRAQAPASCTRSLLLLAREPFRCSSMSALPGPTAAIASSICSGRDVEFLRPSGACRRRRVASKGWCRWPWRAPEVCFRAAIAAPGGRRRVDCP